MKISSSNIFLLYYIVVSILWIIFFFGKINFDAFDWYTIQILEIYKLSFNEFKFPYEVKYFKIDNFWGNKFFTIPWLILTPQLLILNFFSIEFFLSFQMSMMSILTIYSIRLWQKKLKFSNFASIFISFIWIFNGSIICRIYHGHWMMVGFFLIPLYFYLSYQIITLNNRKQIFIYSIILGLFFTFILMQGHMHAIYHLFLITFLISILFYKKLIYFFSSGVVFLLSSFWYYLPKIFFGTLGYTEGRFPFNGYGFGNSYGSRFVKELDKVYFKDYDLNFFLDWNNFLYDYFSIFGKIFFHLIEIFADIIYHITIEPDIMLGKTIHEKSLYLGFIPAILISIGLFFYLKWRFNKREKDNIVLKIEIIFFIMFILSSSIFHQTLFNFINSYIKIPSIDRITYKLFIYCLFILILVSFYQIDKILFKKIKV